MPLTEEQRLIAQSISGTTNVLAGAGTGKTFTLTRRIVHCVEEIAERMPDCENPMERICAITFTTRAASELKSRLRNTLFAEARKYGLSAGQGEDGLDARDTRDDRSGMPSSAKADLFYRCALEVDNAQISTIHSLAFRILREGALEFGIDPTFRVIEEAQSEELFGRALEEVLSRIRAGEDDDLRSFVESVGSASKSTEETLRECIHEKVFGKAYSMPDGLDGCTFADLHADLAGCLKQMLLAAAAVRPLLYEIVLSGKGGQAAFDVAQEMEAARDLAKSVLRGNGTPEERSREFLRAIYAFPPTTNKFPTSPAEYRPSFDQYRRTYSEVNRQVQCSISARKTSCLLRLCRLVEQESQALKMAGSTSLDNGDLILKCVAFLSMPEHADLRSRYQDLFDYIMVDEFQDTDKLQVRLIGLISRDMSNVCTVGDMQQSIYRFRGADVEVARERASSVEALGGLNLRLTRNYRSHPDILDAVEDVFSRDEAFGDDFLKIEAASVSLDADFTVRLEGRPRVFFDFVNYKSKTAKEPYGFTSADARNDAALALASHFSALIDEGESASSMAILLGSMTYAGVYAQALRLFGIDSMIVGGSGFAEMPEAQLVLNLLAFAYNPLDEPPLFNILVSPLFAISDDTLLALCANTYNGHVIQTRLGDAIRQLMESPESIGQVSTRLSEKEAEALQACCGLLARFREDARLGSASDALRRLFLDSGYLARLCGDTDYISDVGNLAHAGNLNKALVLVRQFEKDARGAGDLMRAFRDHIGSEKEAPGVIAQSGANFVSIATVHSAKGLEFKHVAVAELKDVPRSGDSLIVENVGQKTYVSYWVERSDLDDPDIFERMGKVASFTFDDDDVDVPEEPDLIGKFDWDFREKLARFWQAKELAESFRLMYVAMTRAKETLFVSHLRRKTPKGTPEDYEGVFASIFGAVLDHFDGTGGDFSEGDFSFSQGSIGFSRRFLSCLTRDVDYLSKEIAKIIGGGDETDAEIETPDGGTDEKDFIVPEYPGRSAEEVERVDIDREGIESYSSLAGKSHLEMPHPMGGAEEAPAPSGEDKRPPLSFTPAQEGTDASEGYEEPEFAQAADATDFGNAFHRLMQLTVIAASASGVCELKMPDASQITSQARFFSLLPSDEIRLKGGLERTIRCPLAKKFVSSGNFGAEVPFIVPQEGFCLEGQIDALSDLGDGYALFLDYKTGQQSSSSLDDLKAKHLFQAQCYSFALLSLGYTHVCGNFILVEVPAPEDASLPAVLEYTFSEADLSGLRQTILEAYRKGLA